LATQACPLSVLSNTPLFAVCSKVVHLMQNQASTLALDPGRAGLAELDLAVASPTHPRTTVGRYWCGRTWIVG
jgi:hypothetical protein